MFVNHTYSQTEPEEDCDHEWEFQDDSFDHEFGTQQIYYERCSKCGATRDAQPPQFDDYDL